MLIDLNKDWQNRPLKHGLTAAEKQRLLELYVQRAIQRQREAEASEALLVQAALVLNQRGLGGW